MSKINYDAVDFDFSDGIIDGISIINSGNFIRFFWKRSSRQKCKYKSSGR